MDRQAMARREFLRLTAVTAGIVGLPFSFPADARACTGPEPLGARLIGKLERPQIVTDPARVPKAFKEASSLAELVKAGKLPPVEQRVPQEPLVLNAAALSCKARWLCTSTG